MAAGCRLTAPEPRPPALLGARGRHGTVLEGAAAGTFVQQLHCGVHYGYGTMGAILSMSPGPGWPLCPLPGLAWLAALAGLLVLLLLPVLSLVFALSMLGTSYVADFAAMSIPCGGVGAGALSR